MYSEKRLKQSQFLYVLEAAFEYLISLLVAGSFLATLTKELGMSDSLTGIISSFISLGCLFQLLSMAVHRKRMKPFVVFLSVSNQLLFMVLYVIPLTPLPKNVKIPIFVSAILLAYFTYNITHPKKINWFMSLIDDSIRGRFTAAKEMVSLLLGMSFSFGMGAVIDHYKAAGKIRTAFILSAIVIFALMVLHTLTMLLSVEKPNETVQQKGLWKQFFSVIRDPNVLRVTALFVLYQIAAYVSTPFYGTYQINELGFSLKYISVLTIVDSLIRILLSFFLGAYADKKSFAAMLRICFVILSLGYLCAAFSTPENGKWMFVGYYVCHGFAMAGVGSALINLVYDYAPVEKRADSLALSQAVAGLFGFLATLCMSPLISYVQQKGNRLFGQTVYAQQITSVVAFAFTAIAALYVSLAFKRSKKI